MASKSRSSKNNNPHGHNQYTNDWLEAGKDHPITTAAAAAAAVGAGVFLWSKRERISSQISKLSDQISSWAEEMRSNIKTSEMMESGGFDTTDTAPPSARSGNSRSSRSTSKSQSANEAMAH